MGKSQDTPRSWQSGDTVEVAPLVTMLSEADTRLLERIVLHLRNEATIALGRAERALNLNLEGVANDCDAIDMVADWLEDAIRCSMIKT